MPRWPLMRQTASAQVSLLSGSEQHEPAGEAGSFEGRVQAGAAIGEMLPAGVVHGDHGASVQDPRRFGG